LSKASVNDTIDMTYLDPAKAPEKDIAHDCFDYEEILDQLASAA
jgi:hypothetical protein